MWEVRGSQRVAKLLARFDSKIRQRYDLAFDPGLTRLSPLDTERPADAGLRETRGVYLTRCLVPDQFEQFPEAGLHGRQTGYLPHHPGAGVEQGHLGDVVQFLQ